MEDMRNAYRLLVENLNGRNNSEGRPRHTCKAAIETNIKETGCDIHVRLCFVQLSALKLRFSKLTSGLVDKQFTMTAVLLFDMRSECSSIATILTCQ
jgi:hypothetical protein